MEIIGIGRTRPHLGQAPALGLTGREQTRDLAKGSLVSLATASVVKQLMKEKTYNHYTYLGGETRASLPTCERAKIVVNLFEDSITMVRAQQWSSDCLDSIIYLATRSQPATKLHALSTDPALLREMLAKEYKMRRNHGAPDVLDAIMECGDNHDLIINKAVTEGFIKLDMDQLKMGRVRGNHPTRQREHATVGHDRETARSRNGQGRGQTPTRNRAAGVRNCAAAAHEGRGAGQAARGHSTNHRRNRQQVTHNNRTQADDTYHTSACSSQRRQPIS